jgi:hypothetical protein
VRTRAILRFLALFSHGASACYFNPMLNLFFLLLTTAVYADSNLDAGRQFLAEKLPDSAISSFELCLEATPKNADCHWELGWAHWLKNDWANVVKAWSTVKVLAPSREGLATYLAQANRNLDLRVRIAAGREGVIETYRSDVPQGTTITIRAVGDMMIGTDFPAGVLPENDGLQTFAAVTALIQDADLSFGNLEGPLCDQGKTSKCKPGAPSGACYAFRMPGHYAAYFKDAGFDMVSTANNHSGDFGEVCRAQTEALLDAQGIAHSGRPGDIARLSVKGLKLAMIAFHTSAATHDVRDIDTARALVRSLTASHDIIIVSFHGGAEGARAIHLPQGRETFYGEDRGDLRQFSHAVIDAGADLVLGHGPHVLRGMEVYKERLIAYSLGNFATYGRFTLRGPNGLGLVLEATLSPDGRFLAGQLHPTKQVGAGTPTPDPEGAAIDMVRMLSGSDFQNTGILVAQDGSIIAQ